MFVFINTNKHHFPSPVLLEEYLCRAKTPLPVAAYRPWAAFGMMFVPVGFAGLEHREVPGGSDLVATEATEG